MNGDAVRIVFDSVMADVDDAMLQLDLLTQQFQKGNQQYELKKEETIQIANVKLIASKMREPAVVPVIIKPVKPGNSRERITDVSKRKGGERESRSSSSSSSSSSSNSSNSSSSSSKSKNKKNLSKNKNHKKRRDSVSSRGSRRRVNNRKERTRSKEKNQNGKKTHRRADRKRRLRTRDRSESKKSKSSSSSSSSSASSSSGSSSLTQNTKALKEAILKRKSLQNTAKNEYLQGKDKPIDKKAEKIYDEKLDEGPEVIRLGSRKL